MCNYCRLKLSLITVQVKGTLNIHFMESNYYEGIRWTWEFWIFPKRLIKSLTPDFQTNYTTMVYRERHVDG